MSGITFDYIEEYLRSHIPENTGILKSMEDYARDNYVPIVQKEVANLIKLLIEIKKPNKILELGTAIGYSAIFMNICSGGKSEIYTIERDARMLQIANKNILEYEKTEKIHVIAGDCLEVLSNMSDNFDIIFIDAGKGHYDDFLPHCLRLLSKDGIIIADNVLFRGMIATDELVIRRKITIVKRMRSFIKTISEDKNLSVSIIPFGDGVALIRKRDNDET
jgi:predicted O-methyltransferase YrrM